MWEWTALSRGEKHPHIPGEKQLDRKWPGGFGEHQVEHEPAMCPHCKEAKVNLDCIRHRRSRGGILPLWHWWGWPWRVVSMLGLWKQQRHGHTAESAINGHKGDTGTGASPLWREVERAGTAQTSVEKAQVDLFHAYKHLRGKFKLVDKTGFFSGAQKEHQKMGTN